ncbi:DNA/RNA polymerase [Dichomitus squalens LYAD-421 SS1]|uniref:DNA-directed RNA polymerase n=1 Tax=Dichomitus squalens (strain LYAD-421) TaxID=732165 RepID=R7SIE2_DICSQ|nr:DNA/RNA polymerase [Dichomitus squalens LYAD-421 SS1]EJF55919.1 DNA/RNA polymerase [Dichomitus squalens LYAD-421 SS1]
MPSPSGSEKRPSSIHADMHGFLNRRSPYTILPTPTPEDVISQPGDIFFTDSPTQDQVSVIEACLRGLHDVPRAKGIFERLRSTRQGDPILEARMYNSFIEAYLEMAHREELNRPNWLEDAWALYNDMERGHEKVDPTPNTYALMLQAWLRYNPDSSRQPVYISGAEVHDPVSLLRNIIGRQISPALVVSDRAFTSNEEATEAIKALSKAAAEMGLASVVNELGLTEFLGKQIEDPLEDVPEVVPVMRPKKIEVVQHDDGRVTQLATDEPLPERAQGEVPFNLETLRRHLSQVVLARRVLSEDVAARQRLLEQSVYNVAVERMKHQAEMMDQLGLPSKGLQSNDLKSWMWEWHQKLQQRIKAEVENLIVEERILARMKRRSTKSEEILLSPFLRMLSPEKLSLITIMEMMNLHGSGGVQDGMKTARALLSVGRAVEAEHKAEICKKNNISIPVPAVNAPRAGVQNIFTGDGYKDLYARRVTAAKYMEDAEEWTSDWSQLIRVKVGSFLLDCIMDVATVSRTIQDPRTGEKFTEEQPAFSHSYEYQRGRKLGVIKFNPAVADRMSKDPIADTLHPRHLPMLVKPKPWLSYNNGGYLYSRSWAMRFKDSREQEIYLRHASEAGRLELVFAGLDVLGSTPWQINRRVFDVVLQVWNSGERFAKIPPAIPDEPEPVRPENMDTDNKAKVVYLERQRQWMQNKAANHSDRCSVNYKVEIARAFLGDTIYLPHNVDFRGRAYPIPPHLSHIGDDLSRGLLIFEEKKPLGTRGLRWLKIHLANLYGYDKASFDERVEYVHKHLEDIFDSADKPLEGRRWWTKADDPWQCLATCMELTSALRSPDPEAYECGLPVHQDGTCNGLQHYAALGGDAQGAAQVNLAAADRPSDVYTYVANMVEKQIEEDIKKDDPIAKLLEGKVSRKVVKQTVMTTVYGVTYVGARDQIERQLKDRGDIPAEMCWSASAYLAKNVLASIGDLFKGAKDIQNWLNLCARLIAKAIPQDRLVQSFTEPEKPNARSRKKEPRWKKEQMTSVVWTTPLGLPIVQPYRAVKRKQVMTSIQTVFISDPTSPSTVNAQKQASAFPPNFIHSLDATHMMLTALECRARGLTFASVHDSYWTHASSIDQMSEIIRDTFIALHSSDVLKGLYDEFRERYADYKIPLVSLRGNAFKKLNLAPEQLGLTSEDTKLLTEGVAEDEEMLDEDALALDEDEDELEALTEVEQEKPKKVVRKRGPRKIKSEADIEARLAGRFINLVDVLPPLPEKGKFDVKAIKESQYFFS